ncbi:MAG: hypothetical protein RI958_1605 [Actinomycetota bacterium]
MSRPAVGRAWHSVGVHDRSTDLENHVRRAADATGVPYEAIECDPDLADTAAFCQAYGYPLAISANTIVVASKAEPPVYVACVVLATTRLDVNGAVRRRLGARKVSFAPAEATAEVTGMVMGGVTALGLPAGLPIWIDAAVMNCDRVIVGGGSRSLKLVVSPTALAVLADATVVEGLATPTET